MITDNTFGYLKANTVLFAQKVCDALSDMCGSNFLPVKETLREGPFTSPYNITIYIDFTGTIQGNYLVSLNEEVALKIMGVYREGMQPKQVRDLREDFGGLLKEALNLAVGQSIEELKKSLSDLSFTTSTIVYGEIEFPNIMSSSIALEGRAGKILCGFSINLANLKVGEKLVETLRKLELQTSETQETRRNIEAILALLPLGLVAIDRKGVILPGFSKSTPSVIGCKRDARIVGRYLPDYIGLPRKLHKAWDKWLTLVFTNYRAIPLADLKTQCPLAEFTNLYNHCLKLDWLPVMDNNNEALEKLLIVINHHQENAAYNQHGKHIAHLGHTDQEKC